VKIHNSRTAMLLAAAALILGELVGCATTPDTTAQAGIAVLVDAATGVTIQQAGTDPAVQAARAREVVSIAQELEQFAAGQSVTLPQLTAKLDELIQQAKLGPADVLAANTFVAALESIVGQELKSNPNATNVQATVSLVLQDVQTAARLYLPPGG
jgi:hypothetical protein